MKYLFLIIIGLIINGCGSKVYSSNDKQVIVNRGGYGANKKKIFFLAEKECLKYNKHAVNPVLLRRYLIAYTCVEK